MSTNEIDEEEEERSNQKEENSETNKINNSNKKVPYLKLFSFADRVDVVLMIFGLVGAIGNGMSAPLMALFLGDVINSFGSNTESPSRMMHDVSKVALKYVYLGISSAVAALLQSACWMATGERQASRIRGLYLKAILGQDIEFFDTETSTGEVIGRMSGDTILIQEAMSDKVGKFIQFASTFIGGFAIAFARGWLLSLILCACLPFIMASGAIMALVMSKMAGLGQAAYADAGNILEQTVGRIRMDFETDTRPTSCNAGESIMNELCYAFGGHEQIWGVRADSLLRYGIPCSPRTQKFVINVNKVSELVPVRDRSHLRDIPAISSYNNQSREPQKMVRKAVKKQHHLWQKRDSAQSGHKAHSLIRHISGLPNEKEAVYGALDKWIAWETEFPLIAAAKALRMLRKRNQWIRVIQVAKWMLSKGQGATMETYDTLILAFDMERRTDEAESLWDMILRVHTRSTSRRLFSRMISLYDHHLLPDKIIEVFADMEELGVKPDEDTLKRIAQAFESLGQEDKKMLVLRKYQSNWKYIHFNGERVRVRNNQWSE